MPRMSEAEKRKSHIRILDAASQLMRKKGVASTSVSDVMQAAGLTHGGFYRHFGSKEELVETAFRLGVDTALKRLESTQTVGERAAALNTYIDEYLSLEHVRNDQQGCVLAALAAEAARDEGMIKEAASQAVARVISAIANALGDQARDDRSVSTMVFASLMGTVSLARVTVNQDEQNVILKSGREAVALLIAENVHLAPQDQ